MATAESYFSNFSSTVKYYSFAYYANGQFLVDCREGYGGTNYHAVPLFNDITGISPGGLDYKKIGISAHPKMIETISDMLLQS
jgi:hypothetical protein